MYDSVKVGRGELLSLAPLSSVDASRGFAFFKQQTKSSPALSMRSKENYGLCGIHKKVGADVGLCRRCEAHHSW